MIILRILCRRLIETVLHATDTVPDPTGISRRSRDPAWREAIIQAWDRQCAFCGCEPARPPVQLSVPQIESS